MRKFTVPALAAELDTLVSSRFPNVLVEGEISQLQLPASGHCYLQLRDSGGPKGQDCTLQVVVWRDDWNRLRFRPKVGDRVVCRGRVAVFPARVAVQLYVTEVALAGQGEQQRLIEERKARLATEGLLDPRRKRPLPVHPRIVGVATSLSGAALQDFLEVSKRRWPSARILVAGCFVQGAETPSSVVRAVELLIEDGRSEVIVVTRGGGSKEDLMPWNDEALARFLAHCPVPVVSAVGHQIDTTICDLVADAVAPTPSAAAMLVFPDGETLRRRVDEGAIALASGMSRHVARSRQATVALTGRLRHPSVRLTEARTSLETLRARLQVAVQRPMDGRVTRLAALEARLHPSVVARLANLRQRRTERAPRLETAALRLLRERRHALQALTAELHALSPLAVLERGYAIVRTDKGVVTDPKGLLDGARLEVHVKGGTFEARVVKHGLQLPLL